MPIDHIAMYVHDLEGARDFFVRYLQATANDGYHNLRTGLRTYFLTFGQGARLEIMTRPRMVERGDEPVQTGYIHLAFNLGSREAVDALTTRLAGEGYEVLSGPRVTGDGYYESCVLGPEACQLELTV
ncbi:MAG: glyoxalase [Clostridiales bacterium]|nr:glyoxalase [Clostridiales bacterium]